MLLSPSPALQLHAQNALTSIHLPSPEPPVHAQMRGFIFAVRWETGIASAEFLSSILEGERWLVWAAGNVRLFIPSSLSVHKNKSVDRNFEGRRTSFCSSPCSCRTPQCSKESSSPGCPVVSFRSQSLREMWDCES